MDRIGRLKRTLSQSKQQGLALDIDETLAWTNGYWIEQLQRIFGNPEGLSVHKMVERYRYIHNIPYYQTEEIMRWMDKQRHSNEIQELLPMIENANTVVQKIHRIVSIVVYITVRPEKVMRGTRNWLQKHNFPDVEIVARPKHIHHLDGSSWKAGVLEELYPEVQGIIDDNPSLVEHLPKNYKGVIYLYDNLDRDRTDIKVIPCRAWEDVLLRVKSHTK